MVTDAFRAKAIAVDATAAEASAKAFYRSSGHPWSRVLVERGGHDHRGAVAAAFRRVSLGVEDKVSYPRTVTFYRSSGREWTRHLG